MQWVNTQKCLNEYCSFLDYAAKNNMPEYWELRDNIHFFLEMGDTYMDIMFRGPEYWIWANNGRGPGKMPPKDAIDKWIDKRQIVPYKINGVLPSKEQLSFLIRRHIGLFGTPKIGWMEKSLAEQEDYWLNYIGESIGKDIEDELDMIVLSIRTE